MLPVQGGRFARPSPHSAYTYTPSGASPAQLASPCFGPLRCGPDRDRAWHLWSSSSRSVAPRPRSRSPCRLSRRLHGVTRRNTSSAEYRLLVLRRVPPRIRRTEPLRVAQLATRHATPLPHYMLNPFKPPQQPLINSTRPTASWGMQLLLSSLTGRRRAKMLRRKTRLVEGEARDAGAEGCFGAMRRDGEKDGSDPISTRRHFAERLDGTGKM